MSLVTLKTKVEQLIDKVEDSQLPDWDDDSHIIATGQGLTLNGICNCVWELTEKGTLRWKMLDKKLTSNSYYFTAGWTNTALSIVGLDYQAIAPKIRQIYFGDGFRVNEAVFAINCERIRFSYDTLTTTPTVFWCSSLKEIDLSNEIWTTLRNSQFAGAVLLEKVILCPLTTTISNSAFSGCYSLKEIDLSNITAFETNCFRECFSLDKDIIFNPNLTSIASQAFYRTRVKSLIFQNPADNFPTITNNAFGQCRELTEVIVPSGWNTNFYFSGCPLTQECLHAVIENYADMTGQTAPTFQVGTENLEKIDDEHKAMLEAKNINYL